MQGSINFFKGEYEAFSNFHPAIICYQGIEYPTVEHAYQASKTKDIKFKKSISQLAADKAGKAKRDGRRIGARKDWEMVKISIMKDLLKKKFSKPEFMNLLISTGNKYIEEGNYWHDNEWGNCHCKKCSSIVGKNLLGKLLMQIRKDLNDWNSDSNNMYPLWISITNDNVRR